MTIEEVAWDLENAIQSAKAEDPTIDHDPFFQAIVRIFRHVDATVADRRRESGESDITTALIEFEYGTLDESAVVNLFQRLVDTGLAWRLQGRYGRTAVALLESGRIRPANRLEKQIV